jgi:single-strand DNA-binding protein
MLNLAIIAGRLGDQPTIRRTQSGKPVATMSLATSRPKRDAEGAVIKNEAGYPIEDTEWHRVTLWNGMTKVAEKLRKGALVHVQGAIHYSTYTDNEGVKRQGVEIVASELKVLSWGKDASAPAGEQGSAPNFEDEEVPY